MDIETIRETIDHLYEQGRSLEAENVLLSTAGAAAEEGDDHLLLQILNELRARSFRLSLGFWRRIFDCLLLFRQQRWHSLRFSRRG